MKKYLLACGLALASMTVMAAPSVTPSPGTVNTTVEDASYCPGGLATFSINVSGTIDRACEGDVVLYQNGTQIVSIPASNTRRIKCVDGFDTNAPVGTIEVYFYTGSAVTSPYKSNGTYRVVVPAGLYTVGGVPNTAFMVDYTISDQSTSTVKQSVFPEAGVLTQPLKTVTLTFEGAKNLTYNPTIKGTDGSINASLYFSTTSTSEIVPTVTIDGENAVLTLPTAMSDKNITLYVDDNAFSWEGGETSYNTIRWQVSVSEKIDTPLTISPAPGKVTEIPCHAVTTYTGAEISNVLFEIDMPEGATFGGITMMTYLMLQDANGNNVSTKGWLSVLNTDYTRGGSKAYIIPTSYSTYGKNGKIELEPGEYYLSIPAGAIKWTKDGTLQSCEAMKFGPYTFSAEDSKVPEWTIDPANDTTVEDVKVITLTFEEGTKVDVAAAGYATVSCGTIIYDVLGQLDAEKTNVVTYDLGAAISAPGEYTFYVPNDAISANGIPVSITSKFTVKREAISDVQIDQNGSLVSAKFEYDSDYDTEVWKLTAEFKQSETLALHFELPIGYDSLWYLDADAGKPKEPVRHRIPVTGEGGLEAAGFKLAVDNNIPVKAGTNLITFTYASGNEAATPTLLVADVNISTAVEAIEAAETEAEYFNLQGVKVANPENGIFIKVVKGKAVKVVL